jgi:phosphoserine phosphatase RsbU/P
MIRILVVEDEPGIAFGIETDLHAEGYDVTLVGDGAEAIRRALADVFDLILLDVMLPYKDGFEVCRELRERGLRTPIVMLTAKTGEFDKVMGLDLGADDYVTKPFSPRELRARIRTALRHQSGTSTVGANVEWQLQVASKTQYRLFPQFRPTVATLDYAGFCRPALEMSGDYYDFIELPTGKLGLLVVDVAGKGVPAALLMASIHGAMRAHASQFGERCGSLLSELNSLLYESTDAGAYATVFYAIYDEATRTLNYANAGHESPVLVRPTAEGTESIRLESSTVPLGLFPNLPVLQTSLQLFPGDWLVIFTDGVTEAPNENGEEFGAKGLVAAMDGARGDSAEAMCNSIVERLRLHTLRVPQADDITLVTARVR